MIKWSSWSVVRAWWRRDDIAKGLRNSRHELQVHQERFHIRTQTAIFETLQEDRQLRQQETDETLLVLRSILMQQEHTNNLLQMRQAGESAAEDVMKAAQIELHVHPKESPKYLEYQGYVLNLYKSTGVMPTLPNLNHEVVVKKDNAVTGGRNSEVYLGLWLGKVDVAVKSLRSIEISESFPSAQKRFEREINIWHTLEHPNILRFLGLIDNYGPHLCVVSPWQSKGNLLAYTTHYPKANRRRLLADAARGIEYLHSREKPVVHGNLKCANILVTDNGEAVISDFGLSRVIEDITENSTYATLTSSGSNRWCAPELMHEIISPNLRTDVYSFSMTILECLTSKKPFSNIKRDPCVVMLVVDGGRPLRPEGDVWDAWFTDDLWDLLEWCWNHEPALRPPMTTIASKLLDLGKSVPS
ncbi:kinase-like protein [Ramaria rubella]|nr:kinase-like protein [Ramaria rubella]